LDIRDGRILNRIDHGLSEVYNYVEYKDHQLYFQGDGTVTLFKGNTKLIEYEEKFQGTCELLNIDVGIKNYNRGVKTHGESLGEARKGGRH
jgi:hypothetical protein